METSENEELVLPEKESQGEVDTSQISHFLLSPESSFFKKIVEVYKDDSCGVFNYFDNQRLRSIVVGFSHNDAGDWRNLNEMFDDYFIMNPSDQRCILIDDFGDQLMPSEKQLLEELSQKGSVKYLQHNPEDVELKVTHSLQEKIPEKTLILFKLLEALPESMKDGQLGQEKLSEIFFDIFTKYHIGRSEVDGFSVKDIFKMYIPYLNSELDRLTGKYLIDEKGQLQIDALTIQELIKSQTTDNTPSGNIARLISKTENNTREEYKKEYLLQMVAESLRKGLNPLILTSLSDAVMVDGGMEYLNSGFNYSQFKSLEEEIKSMLNQQPDKIAEISLLEKISKNEDLFKNGLRTKQGSLEILSLFNSMLNKLDSGETPKKILDIISNNRFDLEFIVLTDSILIKDLICKFIQFGNKEQIQYSYRWLEHLLQSEANLDRESYSHLIARLSADADDRLGERVEFWLPNIDEMKVLESKAPGINNFIIQNLGVVYILGRSKNILNRYKEYQTTGQLFEAEKKMLQDIGLEPDQTVKSWELNAPDHLAIVERNCSLITYLEQQRPGIIKTLRDEFGINNFARYPERLLIKQFDERLSGNQKYGVILFPGADWNGTFYGNINRLKTLLDDVEKFGYEIKVIEADSSLSAVRFVNRLRKKYGPISFGILGGHGSKESIQLGNGSFGTVKIEKLFQKGAEALADAFVENPSIVLLSCSTGQEGGIAQRFSSILGASVSAPDVPANASDLRAEMNNGKIVLKVKYRSGANTMNYAIGNLER